MSEAPTVQLSRVGVAGVGEDGPVTVDVPKNIGPVRLVRQVGAGAMGVVWLGRHEVLARDVAVKFLLSPGATPGQGPEFEAFIQGARAAAAVRHPALTAVHDAGAAGGVAYIVMEYVDGPTLHDLLRRGRLPHSTVRAVLADLCAGVAELHEQGLVHRDIKPSNVMIGADGTVVLTDFGLACPGRPPGPGLVAGTPAYMAPEMFEGEISPRGDIYAIAATAFELLSGEPAATGNLPLVRAAAKAGVDVRARLILAHAPQGVVEAIERAINKDAMFRPKTARRLAEMFDQEFRGAGVGAASREDLRQLAFARAEPSATTAAPSAARSGSKAATMFDLVAERAERKRRSAPAITEAPAIEPAANESPPAPLVEPHQPAAAPMVVPPPPTRSPAQPVPPAPERPVTPVATASTPVKVKAWRAGARADEAPVRWGVLLLCSVIGAGLMVAEVSILKAEWGWRLAFWISERMGAWDPHTGPVVIDGRTRPGMPSSAVNFFADQLVGPFGLAEILMLLLMLSVYRRWGMRRPRGAGQGVLCGWCGYSAPLTSSSRCPECGRAPSRGQKGDRPPARRWGWRLRSAAGAVVVFVVVREACFDGLVPKVVDARVFDFGYCAPIATASFAAALLVFHLMSRRTAWLDGVPRCGACGFRVDPGRGCDRCGALVAPAG